MKKERICVSVPTDMKLALEIQAKTANETISHFVRRAIQNELNRSSHNTPRPLENYDGELYNADPNCEHNVVPQLSGGVKCTKCGGWFCY